jgi:hypothetical protein
MQAIFSAVSAAIAHLRFLDTWMKYRWMKFQQAVRPGRLAAFFQFGQNEFGNFTQSLEHALTGNGHSL